MTEIGGGGISTDVVDISFPQAVPGGSKEEAIESCRRPQTISAEILIVETQ